MMPRAASTTCLSGMSCESHCAAVLVPSIENQMPESSTMGQAMRLSRPSASSSVRRREATNSPRLTMHSPPAR